MADNRIIFQITGDSSGLEAAGNKAAGALGRVETGAKRAQTASRELQMVMPQLTDVFVSLGSGQNPFTVFLQQGGQLRDLFGGIAPAAQAVGRALSTIINPVTVGAAAVGALAYAYNKGSAEADAFGRAVVLSGNAVGSSVGALTYYAANVAKITGTQSQASAAMAQFAAGGDVPVAMLERVTAAAMRLEKVGGPAIAETAKQYAELAKDPLAASVKLNESTGFLTESVYKQIRALSDQGKTAEAGALAQRTLASAQEQMATQLEARLGTLERAWRGVGGAAAWAWDKILGIGRAEPAEEKIKALQAKLTSFQGLPAGPMRELGIKKMQEELGLLQENVRLEFQAADAKRRGVEQTQALAGWDKTRDQYLTKAEQRERAIAKIREDGARAGVAQAEIDMRVAQARDKFKDEKGPRGPKAADPNAAARGWADVWEKEWTASARLADEATAKTDGLSKAQKKLRDYLVSPGYEKDSAAQRDLIVQLDLGTIAAEQRAVAEKELQRISEESSRAHAALVQSLERGASQAANEVQKLQDEAAAAMLASTANISLAEAIEQVNIGRLREKQTASLGNEDAVLAIEKEIQAREKLLPLLGAKAAGAEIKKERDERVAAEKRGAEEIGQALATEMMRGGQGAGRMLENYFKTLVLKPIFEAAMSPIANGISSFLNPGSIGSGLSWLKYNGAQAGAPSFDASMWEQFLPPAGGFASGGYTGNIGRNKVAGAVHGNEYVFDAAATARIGVGNLDAMRSGGGAGAPTINAPLNLNIDSRTDQAQIATMVNNALQEQQRVIFEQLRVAGVA